MTRSSGAGCIETALELRPVYSGLECSGRVVTPALICYTLQITMHRLGIRFLNREMSDLKSTARAAC